MDSYQAQLLELWTRFQAGEELAAAERDTLHQGLHHYREFRKVALRDQRLDTLLVLLEPSNSPQGVDEFVQSVLQRCEAFDTPANTSGTSTEESQANAVDDDTTASELRKSRLRSSGLPSSRGARNGAHPRMRNASPGRLPVAPPPVCHDFDSATSQTDDDQSNAANAISVAVEANGHEKPTANHRRRSRRTRISHQVIALACAFLFLGGIGALAWVGLTDGDAPNAVKDNSDGTSNAAQAGTDQQQAEQQQAEQQQVAEQQDDQGDRSPNRDQPTQKHLPETNIPVLTEFATLTNTEDALWQTEKKIGDRLGSGDVQLLAGAAELTFDDGAVVRVEAPASFQLVSSAEMKLDRGELAAVVPGQAVGFRVLTPTSNIVDLGTEFDVDVQDSGATDVFVRRGEVAVTPKDAAGQPEEMRLIADGLNQATVFERVMDTPESPVASAARGVEGQFHGAISVNGKVMQFDDAEAFENVRQRVFTGFRSSPNDVMREWADFVEKLQQSNMQGSVTINGVEVGFGNMEEAMRLHEKMREAIQQMGGNSNSAQSNTSSQAFSGTLNINGQTMTFTSREEYEAAKRRLFGSAATFGAGQVDK